jgi:phage/plasmid primase, P4 family, C-terminal domain
MDAHKKGEGEGEGEEKNAGNDLSAVSDLDFYKKENLNLIRLEHGDKRPLGEWKEYQERKITEEERNAFFKGAIEGKNNLGVVCGAISDNLFVLDFDTEELYHKFFTKPDGLVVVKTGRGYHVYFKADRPEKTLKMRGKEGKEVMTLKGEGSYVVAPPSLHHSGTRYSFLQQGNGGIPRVLEGDVRQQVVEQARKIGLTVAGKDTEIDIKKLLKGAPKGNRDNSLMYLIHFLRRGGVGKENALRRCKAWNKRNDPPLDDTTVRYKVDYHYGLAEPYHYFYSLDPGQWNISENLSLINKGKREGAEVELGSFIEEGRVIPKRVADDILGEFTIRTRGGDHQIFFYDDGIYNPKGKELIRNEVEKRLGERSSEHIKNEVIGHIRDTTLTDPSEFNSQKNLTHLENGIFDLDQMKLREFDKDIISTTKLPVRYVEDADCPKFKEFLGQILTLNDASLMQEVFGWCLIKDYRFQKAVMCVGSGANGKSTLLEVLKEFLGRDNIVSVPLQELSRRFTASQLFGKLANIYPDLPLGAFRQTGVFKTLTGGDQISAEVKYSPNFLNFVNYAKMIFSTNKIPETSDESDAFYRRWLLVNFPNVFEGDEADTDLLEKITTAEELSGIFNWAIAGSRRLLKRGGFEYRETEKVRDQYQRMASSLHAFVEDCIEVDAHGWITKEDFYNHYVDYCKSNNLPVTAKIVVGRELPEHVCVVGGRKRTERGRLSVWEGIKFKADSTEHAEEEEWDERSL